MVFLGEVNALPSLESMAKGLRDVEGIMNNMFKVFCSIYKLMKELIGINLNNSSIISYNK